RTMKIGYTYQEATKIHYAEPRTIEKIEVSQDVDIAWFERHPTPMLVAFACYKYSGGQKYYGISDVNPLVLVRAYSIPVVFFCLSLFLARKRKSPISAQ